MASQHVKTKRIAVAPARNVRGIEQGVQRGPGLFVGRRLYRELEVGRDGCLDGCVPERRKKRERWGIVKRPMLVKIKLLEGECDKVRTYSTA